MPTPPVSIDEIRRRCEMYRQCVSEGYTPLGEVPRRGKHGAAREASRRLGIDPQGVRNAVLAEPSLIEREAERSEPPQPTYREIRDATFWRRRALELQGALAAAEHVTEQMAGIRETPWSIPQWVIRSDNGKQGRSVVGAHCSDWHIGEVIQSDELNGINGFDVSIARRRLRRYFEAVCIIGKRWASDTHCEGALLTLAGDLISGDIHDELASTNELTSTEQVLVAVEEAAAGIQMLKSTFGRVHVVSVPGNHGRTTHKPTAKLYSRLSYDTMIASILADKMSSDGDISFQYGAAKDQIVPLFGRTVLVSHGDKIGTKGGMGFAGPNLPIVRGTKKVELQQARFGRRPDLILMGHYHTTSNPGGVLSNGSVPGYGEYADDIRADPEPPQQWAYLFHSKWGLRERAPIMLEDPSVPVKPRVTIPARMAAA